MLNQINKQTILVVDDDARLIRLLREVLCAAKYSVLVSTKGGEAVQLVAMEQPDLVILDIMLNEIDGYEVAKRVREFSDVPIIMLTAKVTEIDILHGFEAGADDYITKPFSSKELLARVNAVLKRSQKDKIGNDSIVVCGDLTIDLASRCVTLDNTPIYLTATEYNLLLELARHMDQVLNHEQLLTAVWGFEYSNDVDYLRSYIHSLRKKLEHDPKKPEMIINIPWVGYMLTNLNGNK